MTRCVGAAVRGVKSCSAMLVVAMLGCSSPPDLVACPPQLFTQETLAECACGLSAPGDGLITAVLATPGSFRAGEAVHVMLAGNQVASAHAAPDGSLAVAVLLPIDALARGSALVLEYGRGSQASVALPRMETAVVTGDVTFIEYASGVLAYGATTRAIAYTDCTGPTTPTPAPSRLFAANLTTSEVAVSHAPPLGDAWGVTVPGQENDLVIVAVQHDNGGVSGCFAPYDICCDCPSGGSGIRLHRAHCTAELRARGMCLVRGQPLHHDAGTDAATDAGNDAAIEPTDAGPPQDMGIPF